MLENDQTKFEDAIKRLEEIVALLENGNDSLEGSLSLFEEGIALVKLCSSQLDGAEQRVKQLIADGNGGYNEREFKKPE